MLEAELAMRTTQLRWRAFALGTAFGAIGVVGRSALDGAGAGVRWQVGRVARSA